MHCCWFSAQCRTLLSCSWESGHRCVTVCVGRCDGQSEVPETKLLRAVYLLLYTFLSVKVMPFPSREAEDHRRNGHPLGCHARNRNSLRPFVLGERVATPVHTGGQKHQLWKFLVEEPVCHPPATLVFGMMSL